MDIAITERKKNNLNNMCLNAQKTKIGDVIFALGTAIDGGDINDYDGTVLSEADTKLINSMCMSAQKSKLGDVLKAFTETEFDGIALSADNVKILDNMCLSANNAKLGTWLKGVIDAVGTYTVSIPTTAAASTGVQKEIPITWTPSTYIDKTYTATVTEGATIVNGETSIKFTSDTAKDYTITLTKGNITKTCVVTVS